MDWLFFSLLTALLWGVGQLFIKIASTSISPLWNTILQAVIAVILYIPFALIYGASFAIEPFLMLLIFIGACMYNLFYYAIEKGVLIITGSILAMYPLVTVLLSVIFLNEPLTLSRIAAVGLILFGIGMLIYRKTKKKEHVTKTALYTAIGGSIAIGIADFIAKISITKSSFETYTLFLPLAYVLSVVLFWIIDKKGRSLGKKVKKERFALTVLGVGMLVVGLLSFNAALSTGLLSSVSMLSSLYVGISAVFAFIFLKERISRNQFVGLLSMFIGALLISGGF